MSRKQGTQTQLGHRVPCLLDHALKNRARSEQQARITARLTVPATGKILVPVLLSLKELGPCPIAGGLSMPPEVPTVVPLLPAALQNKEWMSCA